MTDAYHGPANWLAADMADTRGWVIQLTDEQIATIDTALRTARKTGATVTACLEPAAAGTPTGPHAREGHQ
jgi:hypothetical protein